MNEEPRGAFEFVDKWQTGGVRAEDSCRGLTVLPHPKRPGQHALFGGLEDPGHIVYWEDLDTTPNRVTELDIVDFFTSLGLGGFGPPRIGPYNHFHPTSDPITGESVHLIGVYTNLVGSAGPSHFLVRHDDGTYEGYFIPKLGAKSLRGCRSIVHSPFVEDEGRVYYFAGFDAARGPHEDTAWIYKGTIPPPNAWKK